MKQHRQRLLLDILQDGNWYTTSALALKLGVSSKTIQKDIRLLKAQGSKYNFNVKILKGKGVMLEHDDLNSVSQIMSSTDVKEDVDHIRLKNVMLLLSFKEYITIQELADQLYFSRTMISSILSILKSMLSDYHITIVAKPRYGIQLKGNELKYRSFMIAYKFLSIEQSTIILEMRNPIYEILNQYQVTMSTEHFESFLSEIGFIITRHPYFSGMVEKNQQLQVKDLYQVAIKIGELIERQYHVKLSQGEIDYLCIQLIGRSQKNLDNLNDSSILNDVNRILDNILSKINRKYGVDLTSDFELRMALALHLLAVVSRLRYGIQSINPMIDEIKQNYLLTYDLAIEMAHVLQSEFGVLLDQDEVGYLALHFNLAYIKSITHTSRKQILVICGSGGGMAQLLKYQIQSYFKEEVYIDTINELGLKDVDFTKYDYCLTTIPLTHIYQENIFQIPLVLNDIELKRIETQIQKKDTLGVIDLIHPDLYFVLDSNKEMTKIIEEICKNINKTIQLPSDFLEKVLMRESRFPTEIGGLVAIPHSIDPIKGKSFLSVTILNKPITWKEKKVQVVFLQGIEEGKSNALQNYYSEFVWIVKNKEMIHSLIKNQTYENFIKWIGEMKNEL